MNANFHLKNKSVEARQHKNTNESAVAISQWITENKGNAYPVLQGDAELEGYLSDAYVVIQDPTGKTGGIVRPNHWVVLFEPGVFAPVYPDIFRRIYKAIKATT